MKGKKFEQITEFIESFLEGLLLVYGSFVILKNSVKHDHSFCFLILNKICIIKETVHILVGIKCSIFAFCILEKMLAHQKKKPEL